MLIYCKCSKLLLTDGPKLNKSKVTYSLSLNEKDKLLKWLKEEVKVFDGYASNWSRCINLINCTITKLKSHDVHVFIKHLMSIALCDFVPNVVWEALNEILIYFRKICAKKLDIEMVHKLEKNVIVTMCKLEKIFTPFFLDSMEHLIVHVAHKARLSGSVQYRWVYASEQLALKPKF